MTAAAPPPPSFSPPRAVRTTPREPQAHAVAARGLAVQFRNGVQALRDATLLVETGEHVAIVGPSGSGKTTLLRVLAGELQPDAGQLALVGKAACIYQDYRLVARRSALLNVMHGAAGRPDHDGGRWNHRLRHRRTLRQQAAELLATVGLTHRTHVRVDKLSGGERQRVALARALMANPAVILADEPVSALDAGSAEAVMALLRQTCRQRGVTLISVLHDCKLAETYADRIVSVRDGRLHAGTAGLFQPHDPATPCGPDEPHACHPEPARPRGSFPAQLRINGQDQPASASDTPHRFDPDDPRCAICPDNMPAVVAEAAPPIDPRRWSARAKLAAGLTLLLAALLWALWMSDLSSIRLDAVGRNLSRFGSRLIPTADQLANLDLTHLAASFLQTLAMTLLGTVAAIAWSLPLSALAARNGAPAIIRVPVRLMLNVIRSVPSILWALVAVGALGLGPLPGIVALAAYSTGYLTKFFYEAFESVDDAVPAALTALGMSKAEAFLAAVWPASRLALISACIFMLEYNFRAASVLGVVGAGGIGYDLKLAVEWSNWHVVGVILAVLAGSVIVFDALADYARRTLR